MSALHHTGSVEVFKARSNKALAVVLWALAAFGLVVTLAQSGITGLRFAAPLALMAFAGWSLFWRPAVVVSDAGVELVNPLRRIGVSWEALAFVDTKYALTLGTGAGRFAAWAAPAPGVLGARHARPESLTGLPATSYGPGQTVRPGDLSHTVSGQAALLVRRRWADQVERGLLEGGRVDETPVARGAEWWILAVAVLLAAATLATLV
ncbi:PH domain-containing protein [Sinomonas humi]|uniref:Membrane protein n=1 Tax=Sinomonas humi TaxID=1338436 RepID=A0A0B2AID5_9MICC|nr:PH domain-containing protein [Sinomonas humi]KHL01678.1 membrane protein [Sinomonas humi]